MAVSSEENEDGMTDADELDDLERDNQQPMAPPQLSPLRTAVQSPSAAKFTPRPVSFGPTRVHTPSTIRPSTFASYRSPALPETPSTISSFSPGRFTTSPTVSPGARSLSITPRNTYLAPVPTSITPTAKSSTSRIYTSADDQAEVIDFTDDDDDNWGGEAVLQWDGVDMTGDSASSVAPGDAGLDSDELEDEEAEWGNEAVLEFGWNGDGGIDEDDSDQYERRTGVGDEKDDGSEEEEEEEMEDDEEEVEMMEDNEEEEELDIIEEVGPSTFMMQETPAGLEELRRRGMPDYASWEIKKLQRLCTGYGYRPSKEPKALQVIATACWKALNPPPTFSSLTNPSTPLVSKSKRGKSAPTARRASITSEDVPLSAKTIKGKSKAAVKARQASISSVDMPLSARKVGLVKGKGKARQASMTSEDLPLAAIKGKGKSKTTRQASITSDDVPLAVKAVKGKSKGKGKAKVMDEEDIIPIEERFAAMIKGDPVLYLRILQYEPIHFDELVNKASGVGISDVGWKIALKKFLDFEGITFYTEDPTGPRRSRH